MSREFENLLRETQELARSKRAVDKEKLHSKILALYMYLERGERKNHKYVEEYNKLAEECKEKEIRGIKLYKNRDVEEEKEIARKREDVKKAERTEQIAASILEHSRTLKKKTEAFGAMVDISKDLVEKVAASVRKNVYSVEKGVEQLEKRHWWSFTTRNTVAMVIFVIIVFIFMYFFIRIS